jgi:transcription-repair coupling factor (superfamily II helicase)
MLIEQLASRLLASKPIQTISSRLEEGADATLGVSQSARPLMVATAFSKHPRSMFVVVSGESSAQRFANALSAYLGRERVLRLPLRTDLPWQEKTSADVLMVAAQRCRVLDVLEKGDSLIVVSSTRALLRCVPPGGSDVFKPLVLRRGQEVDFDRLPDELVARGYERLDGLDGPGTFMLRGDTLDLYPANSTYPVRAEFFGDELDGMRRLVPSTGQSIGDVDEVDVYPCREMRVSARGLKRVHAKYDRLAEGSPEVASQLEMLDAGIPFSGMDLFLPELYRETCTPLEHLAPDTLVVLSEPRSLFDDATRYFDEVSTKAREAHVDLSGLFVKPDELDFGTRQRLTLLSLLRAGGTVDAELVVKRPEMGGTQERFFGGLRGLVAGGMTTVLSIPDHHARSSVELELSDARIPFAEVLDNPASDKPQPLLGKGVVNVVDTDIPSGLVIPEARLGIVSIADAGGRSARRSVRKQVDPTKLTFPYKPGDYVVHAMHGIALFKEIVHQEVAGVERDYLLLEYAEGDRLFVPVEQVDRVTRYVGPSSTEPRLTRLNTSDWTRSMGRARKSAKKLAFDLVDLYARRSTVTGFRYSPDTPWQREMEESFPYEETPDQLAAIADIKADMESDRPMDRLVCGDVGFGKTEVVLRAAFKALQDHRQVMVLCPTTILAQQHFELFSERFEPFAVRVEVLSRFRTAAQQRQTLEDFAAGKVDVLIGTHRLLSRDVNPKDLGLVIIDEEQRFGVQHKEQLKNLREQVDVITLSATPIPRTMQMALSGVRDMSLIETPPPGRIPVKVHVGEWDEDLVSAAIRREVERGGQVYYVSNRVKTIQEAVNRVEEAAPEARIGVAHGKLNERQLEKVMTSFASGDIDVLVATTIIENGLDNPRTNTLIIEDSQRLGLAQLYQLKGRVGRGRVQAYAYFLFPTGSLLTEQATDRLEAITEFQSLGSGTKIAMRDLEIRGAGNLLGAEQSGNMSAVGFDLYAQMLSEAVSAARGEPPIAHSEVSIDLPEAFFLPEDYIPAVDERMIFYRRLAAAAYPETVDQIEQQLTEHYGELPQPALGLLARCRIKIYAAALGADRVALTNGKLLVQTLNLGARARSDVAVRHGVYLRAKGRLRMPVPKNANATATALEVLEMLVADEEAESSEASEP